MNDVVLGHPSLHRGGSEGWMGRLYLPPCSNKSSDEEIYPPQILWGHGVSSIDEHSKSSLSILEIVLHFSLPA